MVIDKPARLQKGIANGAADKLESAFFKVFRERIAQACLCRDSACPTSATIQRVVVDELPEIGFEASEFFLYGECGIRI